MVVARSGLAQEKLWSDFKSRRVGKIYLALCRGAPVNKKARIDLPIGRDPCSRLKMAVVENGREAVTEYEVLWSRYGHSLVMCSLFTGRTHQIRVHMRAIGCPLAGDTLYSKKNPTGPAFAGQRVFLHSWRLSFAHPRTGEKLSFKVPLPEDLKNFLLALR